MSTWTPSSTLQSADNSILITQGPDGSNLKLNTAILPTPSSGVTSLAASGNAVGVSSPQGAVTLTSNITGGSGLSVTGTGGNVSLANTGVRSVTVGTGLSATSSAGDITLSNTGITSLTPGVGISAVTSVGGAATIANTGVTSVAAGTGSPGLGIGVSSSTGSAVLTNLGVTSVRVAGTGISATGTTNPNPAGGLVGDIVLTGSGGGGGGNTVNYAFLTIPAPYLSSVQCASFSTTNVTPYTITATFVTPLSTPIPIGSTIGIGNAASTSNMAYQVFVGTSVVTASSTTSVSYLTTAPVPGYSSYAPAVASGVIATGGVICYNPAGRLPSNVYALSTSTPPTYSSTTITITLQTSLPFTPAAGQVFSVFGLMNQVSTITSNPYNMVAAIVQPGSTSTTLIYLTSAAAPVAAQTSGSGYIYFPNPIQLSPNTVHYVTPQLSSGNTVNGSTQGTGCLGMLSLPSKATMTSAPYNGTGFVEIVVANTTQNYQNTTNFPGSCYYVSTQSSTIYVPDSNGNAMQFVPGTYSNPGTRVVYTYNNLNPAFPYWAPVTATGVNIGTGSLMIST